MHAPSCVLAHMNVGYMYLYFHIAHNRALSDNELHELMDKI